MSLRYRVTSRDWRPNNYRGWLPVHVCTGVLRMVRTVYIHSVMSTTTHGWMVLTTPSLPGRRKSAGLPAARWMTGRRRGVSAGYRPGCRGRVEAHPPRWARSSLSPGRAGRHSGTAPAGRSGDGAGRPFGGPHTGEGQGFARVPVILCQLTSGIHERGEPEGITGYQGKPANGRADGSRPSAWPQATSRLLGPKAA